MEFLKALIVASEKASNIARLLRQNKRLFDKLVERKSAGDANSKFQDDFKTLADVLIQEMVKHDVGKQFPAIKNRIKGEESNNFFSRSLNTDITVEVKETENETYELLLKVLEEDEETAKLLAAEVHRCVRIDEIDTVVPDREFDLDVETLSIWIDPIDGTNEYVKGTNDQKVGNFYTKGIKCVTLLIGAYDEDGRPVLGVINRPFFEKITDHGFQCEWGLYTGSAKNPIKMTSVKTDGENQKKVICVGSKEKEEILSKLQSAGYKLVTTRCAGYKLLTVVLGLADAYVLSEPTTFFWDTCGPQAVLRALGGDIVEFNDVTLKKKTVVSYCRQNDASKDNRHGIVAYRSEGTLNKLLGLDW